MRLLIFCALLLPITSQGQNLTPEVGLRNDVVLHPGSIVSVDRGKETSHLLLENKDRVSIRTVEYYQTNSDFYLVKKMEQIGYVEMLRIEDGKIPVFEFSKEIYNPYFAGGISNNTYTYYIFDSELKPLNRENLKVDLRNDDKSMNLLKRYTTNKIVHTGLLFSGIALAAYGISKMFVKDEGGGSYSKFSFKPNLPFIGGVVLIAVPFSLFRKNKIEIRDIVKEYNHRHHSDK